MKKYLKKLPRQIQDLIQQVYIIACRRNLRVYLVGGFVRDLILGVRNLDLDVVTESDAIVFAEDFANTVNGNLKRHPRFGTASVAIDGSIKVDFATVRREFYPQPASLPVVGPGTLKDDLARRDFTINAMAMGVSQDNYGLVIDFFKGKEDIRNKKIRIMHDLSFIDDPTRIFRAIRFEQRYGFKIDNHTLKLLKHAVVNKAIEKVSPHRLRDEIILILSEPHAVKYIKRINKLVGFSFISPRLHYSKGRDSLLSSVEKEILWFSKFSFKKRRLDVWLIYFIGLISNLSTKEIRDLNNKFGFSKGDFKRILSYKDNIIKKTRRLKGHIPPSQIYRILEPLSYEVILLLKAACPHMVLNKNIEDFINKHDGVMVSITGSDLSGLKISPGPGYKNILTQALYAKLDGKISTKEQELQFVEGLISRQRRL